MATLVLIVFLIGLVLISTEQRSGINKSAAALVTAGITWTIIAGFDSPNVIEHLTETGAEVVEVVLFLLSAMALVEVIAHYQFFDVIKNRIFALNFNTKKQLWVISIFAFFLSAVIDNLTTTIIFAQLSRLFFKGKNLIIATALVVIAANSGGAFSPIGDITTTMLWLQEKFSSAQIITLGFLPSLLMYLISAFLLIMQVKNVPATDIETERITLVKSEKAIVILAFGSFALPFVFNMIGLKPYLGLLVGLGITWAAVDICKKKLNNHASHFTATIENMLSKTDISSLMFFSGILLAVAALNHVGILSTISHALFGANPDFTRLVAGSTILGISSSLVDNVPLTAAAMDIVRVSDPRIWVLIAIAVGNGGSALAIGSAAGIVAMGITKEMTFTSYLKYATVPVLIAYGCAIGIWVLQCNVFQ
ncbi:MAG: sodium:proton antiporter NhaD [Rubrobacteridae bacterium]|nr:sodium:proton antiporter NhaD [Rubrobacteridae bacterium]